MSFQILNLVNGKVNFSNSSVEEFPKCAFNYLSKKDDANIILTVEGDNVNAWYDKVDKVIRTSAKFTGIVHFRIG